MLVKQVFLPPTPLSLSESFVFLFLPTYFLILLLNSQGGIDSMLSVCPPAFCFICASLFTSSHAFSITLCIHCLPLHTSSPLPLCCHVYIRVRLSVSSPPVHPVSDISSMWLVFTSSQLHFPLQKSTVSEIQRASEIERGSNRRCLVDPSNHSLCIVAMEKTRALYLLGSGNSSRSMHWKSCCSLAEHSESSLLMC